MTQEVADQIRTNVLALLRTSRVRVYNGVPGCMCGCKGKYSTSSDHPKANSSYQFENVSDRSVKLTVNKIAKWVREATTEELLRAAKDGRDLEATSEYVYLCRETESGSERVHAVYLDE